MPSIGAPSADGRQVEALAPREDDLDRLAGRDRVLGPLHGADVLVAAEARLDLAQTRSVGGAVVRGGAPERRRHLGLARAGGPLERLEDRPLGDPVPAVEVRRLRVERRDRAQLVAEVIEHDHEVRLDEARQRGVHRVAVGQRHGRLERRDRVVAEGAHGPAGEPRHPVHGHDATLGDERAEGLEGIGRVADRHRQVRGIRLHADRAGGHVGLAVADLQQPPRADAQEAVAAEPLPALDGLEEVGGRHAVVEAEEGADRRLEVRGARRAQQDRVGAAGEALGLGQAQRIGHGSGPQKTKTTLIVLVRDERSKPSAVPPTFGVAAALCDRRIGDRLPG